MQRLIREAWKFQVPNFFRSLRTRSDSAEHAADCQFVAEKRGAGKGAHSGPQFPKHFPFNSHGGNAVCEDCLERVDGCLRARGDWQIAPPVVIIEAQPATDFQEMPRHGCVDEDILSAMAAVDVDEIE